MSAAKPRTVRACASVAPDGHVTAQSDMALGPGDYRCLIVPDVPCGHAPGGYPENRSLSDERVILDNGWCPNCGAWWDGTRWRKPAILRAGRAKR